VEGDSRALKGQLKNLQRLQEARSNDADRLVAAHAAALAALRERAAKEVEEARRRVALTSSTLAGKVGGREEELEALEMANGIEESALRRQLPAPPYSAAQLLSLQQLAHHHARLLLQLRLEHHEALARWLPLVHAAVFPIELRFLKEQYQLALAHKVRDAACSPLIRAL
jgi:hypothetical protein